MYKIGVISDTHGQNLLVREAVDICREMKVQRIIHCGDIGGLEIIRILSEFPVDYVFGNCDSGLIMTYTDAIRKSGGTLQQKFGILNLEGKRIAFFHLPDAEDCLRREIASCRWDLICYGHTHRHFLESYKLPNPEAINPEQRTSTLVLNPGSFDGRWETSGFCVVSIPDMEVLRVPLG